MREKILQVQKLLQQEGIDGWLLYDFQKRNSLAIQFLKIPETAFLTRRFFYWIPATGDPCKIVHSTEEHVLDFLPGNTKVYFEWKLLEKYLKTLLSSSKCIAMEYSPMCAIPSISFVDGGTLDWIRSMGPDVISSGGFIQQFTCVLSKEERKSHLDAAKILEETAAYAWRFISTRLKNQEKVTEWDVKREMSLKMEENGCIFEGGPICAVNENSSNPHYEPLEGNSKEIQKGDFILIDLWCKKKSPGSIYADISRVAVADSNPTTKQQRIFDLVRKAQEEATDLIRQRVREQKEIKGFEVDAAARNVIEKGGFGPYFVHRTGHNIHTKDHGPGTHMDSIETQDDRKILAETCFSIEPGIYLPGEFGVRLEYDVFITAKGEVEVSGGVQESIETLSL